MTVKAIFKAGILQARTLILASGSLARVGDASDEEEVSLFLLKRSFDDVAFVKTITRKSQFSNLARGWKGGRSGESAAGGSKSQPVRGPKKGGTRKNTRPTVAMETQLTNDDFGDAGATFDFLDFQTQGEEATQDDGPKYDDNLQNTTTVRPFSR